MITNEYTLELSNVFHTGEVEQGTWVQKVMDSVKAGLILKDVSMEVHSGELLAVLGSKGSGKRALLEVISRRAQGPTRGEVLLNGAPMNLILFQNNCGYVTHKCDLLPALSVMQTLNLSSHLTIGSKVTKYMKRSRVRQVVADLALTQVANRQVHQLSESEYRRLAIGVQLVRDPVLLLLDEPTWDLDPLNTYLVVSILSNHAKKYNRAVILTMEKPRSDVFPFLDRVTYLCLGEVVYTGATQFLLDYFRNIGFPCPELENPLMYYLCLSTVDRRSRERFIESNQQIAALVEKFKVEGAPFRKAASGAHLDPIESGAQPKVPLSAFGQPGTTQVFFALLSRMLLSTFSLSWVGAREVLLRLLVLPLGYALLYALYCGTSHSQTAFVTLNGLLFNMLALSYLLSILTTIATFSGHVLRYYQESQEGLYSGPLFYITYTVYSIFFTFFSTMAGSRILLQLFPQRDDTEWLYVGGALWSAVVLAEHQTVAVMLLVKSRLMAGLTTSLISFLTLVLASGSLRSYAGLPEWLGYLTYGTQVRYLGLYLSSALVAGSLVNTPQTEGVPCTNRSDPLLCRFSSGDEFLRERYGDHLTDTHTPLTIALGFSLGLFILNCLLYLVPLPAFVKAKFRQ